MAFKGSVQFLDRNSANNYRVPARHGAPQGTHAPCCRPKQAAYPAMEASLMRAILAATVCASLPKQLCITTVVPEKLFIEFLFTFKSLNLDSKLHDHPGVPDLNAKPWGEIISLLFKKYLLSAFYTAGVLGRGNERMKKTWSALVLHAVID